MHLISWLFGNTVQLKWIRFSVIQLPLWPEFLLRLMAMKKCEAPVEVVEVLPEVVVGQGWVPMEVQSGLTSLQQVLVITKCFLYFAFIFTKLSLSVASKDFCHLEGGGEVLLPGRWVRGSRPGRSGKPPSSLGCGSVCTCVIIGF